MITDVAKDNQFEDSSSFGRVMRRMSGSGPSLGEMFRIGSPSEDLDEATKQLNVIFKSLIKKLFMRLLFTAIILTCVLFIQASLIMVTENQYDSNIAPLQDRLHEIFEESKALPFTRVNMLISFLVIAIVIKSMVFTPPFQSLINLMRVFLMLSAGYMIRGFFIALTTVPSATRRCIPGSIASSYKIWAVLGGNFGLTDSCTDNIISGHAFSTILCSLIWLNMESNIFVRISLFIYMSIICFLIIVTRGHYTIDVFFGILHAVILYNIYNISLRLRIATACEIVESSKIPRKHIEFGAFFKYIGHVIGWFEMIDTRLKIIQLSITSQSKFHKDFMGVKNDSFYDAAFDVVYAREMCKGLNFTNIILFSKFVKSLFTKCKC